MGFDFFWPVRGSAPLPPCAQHINNIYDVTRYFANHTVLFFKQAAVFFVKTVQ